MKKKKISIFTVYTVYIIEYLPKELLQQKKNCYLNTNKSKLKEKDVYGKLLGVNTVCLSKVKNINHNCIII